MIKRDIDNEQYKAFMDELDASAYLSGSSTSEEVFIDERCQFLVEQDILQSYTLLNFSDDELNCKIDAWGFKPSFTDDSEDIQIVLVISLFSDLREEPEKMTFSDFRIFINKARRFIRLCMNDSFRTRLEAGSSIANFADYIYEKRNSAFSVTIVGLTNYIINARSNTLIISENTTSNITFRYDVWDINRLIHIDAVSNGREPVDIDFVDDYEVTEGIQSLKVENGMNTVNSYIFVLPGKILAEMYNQWNERLLEQNPRTFLQFTGKINKGIRGTLISNPDRFFCYNNGIVAVCDGLEFNPVNGYITKIFNMQIVNGGQTTASIYNAYCKPMSGSKIDIDKVFVMVKLVEIPNKEFSEELIPKISEYSNSQNKVAASLFSSRHPFHQKIEELSRHTIAPSNGERIDTYWYYERVQGQYKNAIALRKSKQDKKLFELKNPKDQMFKFVDLAKYAMTMKMRPYTVCLGAQKCYAMFARECLAVDVNGNGVLDPNVNEMYFKEICCQSLMAIALQKQLSTGIRFVVVPYTISCLLKNLSDKGLAINYQAIWNMQWNNEILFNALKSYADKVYQVISESMPADMSLLSEWGKKKECWDNYVSRIKLDISVIDRFVLQKEQYDALKSAAKQSAKIDIGVNLQKAIIEKPESYWKALYRWLADTKLINDNIALGCLLYACQWSKKMPTEKQSRIVLDLEAKAIKYGFTYKG